MITEVPSPADFNAAGINHIYLAWQIAIQAAQDCEEAEQYASHLDDDEAKLATADYWSKSQPVLANAFGLIQQAIEMALKGRIAAISPYLLIARDPKDWPGKIETDPIPFSDFRTLDAADLVKVHNAFAAVPLDNTFRAFWDELRRDRNKLMHSVPTRVFNPTILIRNILITVETLFSQTRWPQLLFSMENEGKYSAYGFLADTSHNMVVGQIEIAVRNLAPSESKRFFGFDPKRRSYICPLCWGHADRDWQENWPTLAQLSSKSPKESNLHCVVCDETTIVERIGCINPGCKSTVIHEETCLSCLWSQDSPHNFPSGLQDSELSIAHEYNFTFRQSSLSTSCYGRFVDRHAAIEHARRAMSAPYLQGWHSVTINHQEIGKPSEAFGIWIREATGLSWYPGAQPSLGAHEPSASTQTGS